MPRMSRGVTKADRVLPALEDGGRTQRPIAPAPVSQTVSEAGPGPLNAGAGAPGLSGLTPAVAFDENHVNARPQLLDADVVFSDPEGDFAGGTLTLSGLLAEDRVSVRNEGTGAGQIGLSGADVTYGGVVVGTLAGGVGGTLTVTFNAAATSAAIDALIQNLTYANAATPRRPAGICCSTSRMRPAAIWPFRPSHNAMAQPIRSKESLSQASQRQPSPTSMGMETRTP